MKRLIAAISLATALAAGGAGCGAAKTASGGGVTVPNNSTVPTNSSPTTSTGAVAPRAIGKTVWFSGFKVTLDTAAVSSDNRTSTLTVASTFENLGNDPAPFDGTVSVSSKGQDHPSDSIDSSTVPGAGKAKGKITFTVDDKFSLDDAVMTFGKPSETQGSAPLGTAGALVALKPTVVTSVSPLTLGPATVTFTTVEVTASQLQQFRQADKGHWFMYLEGTISADTTSDYYGAEISLKAPDGTSSVGEAAIAKKNENGSKGSTGQFSLRFVVPDPVAGNYTGVISRKSFTSDTPVTATFKITIPAAGA